MTHTRMASANILAQSTHLIGKVKSGWHTDLSTDLGAPIAETLVICLG